MVKRQTRRQKGGGKPILPDTSYGVTMDEHMRCNAHIEGEKLINTWLESRAADISRVTDLFVDETGPDEGKFKGTISATAFSDLYKWTMLPVVRKLETYKPDSSIVVTFGIDLRDDKMRLALKTDPELCTAIHAALKTLETRKFNRDVFTSILEKPRQSILTPEDIDAVCGPAGSERTLVDKEGVQPFGTRYDQTPEDIKQKKVTVSFYENPDALYKAGEQGVHFIEATGPWHRITWLETTLMQCVYEAKLRYDLAKKGKTYRQWLYGALLRCAKSVAYTRMVQAQFPAIQMKPALFTGRRTGGLLFLLLQNMFFADHFKQFGPLFNGAVAGKSISDPLATEALGTSSCDAWYILKSLNLPCLNPAGTHAHELSMVSSVLFPQLDQNDQHLPLTQIVGHYLYSKLTWEKSGKAGPMPMLPDTLGTRAFMKAANYVKQEDGSPFLSLISSGRQDSGKLKDFKANMAEYGYKGAVMASEIDDTSTLLEAATLGYPSFGAGGFFGDSEKVWGNKDASSNSMAVKAVRVQYSNAGGLSIAGIPYMKHLDSEVVIGYPVKIGDPADAKKPQLAEGKLSLDKNLTDAELEPIKKYAETVRVYAKEVPAVVGTKSITSIFTVEGGMVKPQSGGSRKSRKASKSKKQRKTRRN